MICLCSEDIRLKCDAACLVYHIYVTIIHSVSNVEVLKRFRTNLIHVKI
jgi:hypothetical protein